MVNHGTVKIKTDEQVKEEVEKEAKFDIVSQIVGVLSASIPLLAIMGITFDWLNESFIDSVEALLIALIPFVLNITTIVKNHFVTDVEKRQNEVLKKRGLRE